MSQSDRQQLATFLLEVEESVIDSVVIARLSDLVPEEAIDAVLQSWAEIRPLLAESRERLAEEHVLAGLDEQLDSVGLSGAQLTVKLDGFHRALVRLYKRFGRRRLRRVLEWTNRILGSLVSALPVLEPLKEFKESLEGLMIERDDERYRRPRPTGQD